MVQAGDDLPALILTGLKRAGQTLQDRDVIVIAQKIVSKAEGRTVDLADVVPSAQAIALASKVGKDPHIVEVVLSESAKVVRSRPNNDDHAAPGWVLSWRTPALTSRTWRKPTDAIAPCCCPSTLTHQQRKSAFALLNTLTSGVVISDSFGRPWRRGTAGVAIGSAGNPSIHRPARQA